MALYFLISLSLTILPPLTSHPAQLWSLGGKEKKKNKKLAIAFIINPFSCKSPSPKKMHMLICLCNQLYSSFL